MRAALLRQAKARDRLSEAKIRRRPHFQSSRYAYLRSPAFARTTKKIRRSAKTKTPPFLIILSIATVPPPCTIISAVPSPSQLNTLFNGSLCTSILTDCEQTVAAVTHRNNKIIPVGLIYSILNVIPKGLPIISRISSGFSVFEKFPE